MPRIPPSRRVTDGLEQWAAGRAPDVLARAEAEAVALLRDALVQAALRGRERAPSDVSAARTEPPGSRPAAGDLVWAYCVAAADAALPASLGEGVASTPVARVESAGLVALVSRVPRIEFGETPLRDNLNDMPWLERVARQHETVLERALAATTIVPLRMCTLYESEDSVQEMLGREREALTQALAALDGRQEWGVKLLVDPGRLAEEARVRGGDAEAFENELQSSGEGGAYLVRRRQERHVRELAHGLAAQVAEEVHARLQDWALDAIRRPPQNRELSGHAGEMLLNGAYLIETERVDGLRKLVAELEDRHAALGARIELTGPWPPYNFVARDPDR
jgi:hypothetical protein